MMSKGIDYRSTLKSKLADRRRRNPSYSLRAFARDLGMSASHLSEVIRRKGRLSLRSAELVVTNLELEPDDRLNFLWQVGRESIRSDDSSGVEEAMQVHRRAPFSANSLSFSEATYTQLCAEQFLLLQSQVTKFYQQLRSEFPAAVVKEPSSSLSVGIVTQVFACESSAVSEQTEHFHHSPLFSS